MYQTLQTICNDLIDQLPLHLPTMFGALEIGAHVHIMTVKSSAQYACERVSLDGCIKL